MAGSKRVRAKAKRVSYVDGGYVNAERDRYFLGGSVDERKKLIKGGNLKKMGYSLGEAIKEAARLKKERNEGEQGSTISETDPNVSQPPKYSSGPVPKGPSKYRDDFISIGGAGGGRDTSLAQTVAGPSGFLTASQQKDLASRGKWLPPSLANVGGQGEGYTDPIGEDGPTYPGDEDDWDDWTGDEPGQIPVGTRRNILGVWYVWNGTSWVPEGSGGIGDGGTGDGDGDGDGDNQTQITTNLPSDWETMSAQERQNWFESQRRTRISDTGGRASQIARGEIEAGTIPVPVLDRIDREGTEARTVTAPDITPADTFTMTDVGPEAVDTVDTETLARIDPAREVAGGRFEGVERVEQAPEIIAAQQDKEDLRIAEAADVGNVPIIEGAEVEIEEGAIAEAAKGTLSIGSISRIVENNGSSLAKVTRAKKQLRNAGLSEEAISELGNDPESLEEKLTDFTEQERGIIEGLPEEALVSNQLQSLLEGVEEGEIPLWARPAVTSVETMLAKRGLNASSIARDALVNTLVTSALPIADANAKAIQASVAQQKDIESREAEANAVREQQTVLTNTQKVFDIDMAQFTADQQTEIANSKFLQTVSLTEADNEQKSTIQQSILTAQMNVAEADLNQKAQIENAKNFLASDMANLQARQQSNMIKAQYEQQRMLSNQSAENARRQFNATSDQQAEQFMAQLETQIRQYNAGQINLIKQYNSQAENAANARDAQRIADVNRTNATILNQVEQFNEQMNFNREQWNSANEQAIINSNIDWRRKANTADTAAQNAMNQQNAQNAFGLTQAAQSFLWQELRDQADYDFRWATDSANRKLQAMVSAAQAEGDAAKTWSSNWNSASSKVGQLFGSGDTNPIGG